MSNANRFFGTVASDEGEPDLVIPCRAMVVPSFRHGPWNFSCSHFLERFCLACLLLSEYVKSVVSQQWKNGTSGDSIAKFYCAFTMTALSGALALCVVSIPAEFEEGVEL